MARTNTNRLLVSVALVLGACAASYLLARGSRKPFSPDAPEFRRQGPASAPIVIIEFSDFECPACRIAEAPLRSLLKLYEGKVRLVFKHFPLERVHRWARPSAIAAECAGRQGAFWPYHDMLYDRQGQWVGDKAEDALLAYAKELKLDEAAWQACRKDPGVNAAVGADIVDGGHAFVGATPTFFINGKRFVGGKDLSGRGVPFLDKELKK
ncbi:MAG: thioredoxin domain-containing protein [Elusimicrobia bacterium]|nr:thioredoxin domain-containing protein [Elusimicrobiota bacterium]